MIIRYMNSNGMYFSLNDVADMLSEEDALTKKQNQFFKTNCKAYMSRALAKAYRDNQIVDHLQPVILPFSDYFIHYEAWENLLLLLPKTAAQHRKIIYLGYMLSEPDSVYRYPNTFKAIDLICLNQRVNMSIMALPGPLVMEKREN